MKYLDEFRNADGVKKLSELIHQKVTKPWAIMEICGGQTHSIVKYRLTELIPSQIELIHGPGCPVCVTPQEIIDGAIELSLKRNVILTSFGDMMRVPGSTMSLLTARAKGADIRTVYSPLDSIKIAQENPTREVVFLGIGFETTSAPNAMALYQAYKLNLKNFSLLISQVRVPPAMDTLLSSPECQIQGFLAAGHVCTIMGTEEYLPIAEKYKIPIVVTGFEPMDILQGLLFCITQLEEKRHKVEIQYSRIVKPEGNLQAKKIMNTVFEEVDQNWRGIGIIPKSGLGIRKEFQFFDAKIRFALSTQASSISNGCISGLILQGQKKPFDCPNFKRSCNPDNPLGAPMVSSEGACAAYYHFGRN